MYRTDLIEDSPGLEALRPEWDELLARSPEGTVFQTWEWQSTWWRVFGGRSRLRVLATRDSSGALVGLAPLVLRTARCWGLPARELVFLGEGLSDRQDVLLSPAHPEAAGSLLQGVLDLGGWDLVRMENVPETSPLLARAAPGDAGSFREAASVSPYVRVEGSWEAYLQSLGRKYRRDIANKTNKLGRRGAWSHEQLRDPVDTDALVERMAAIEGRSRKRRAGTAFYLRPGHREFMRRFLPLASRREWLSYHRLVLDGREICYLLGFRHRGRILAYNMAYDEAVFDVSPGKLLLHHAIRECFENPGGIGEIDLSRGDHYLKTLWSSERRAQERLLLFAPRAYGRLLGWTASRFRPWLKRRLDRRPSGNGEQAAPGGQE